MEQISKSIEYAMNAQPIEFKSAIFDALSAKISDAIQIKKIEIGGNLLNPKEEMPQEEEDTFKLEDNLDEEL